MLFSYQGLPENIYTYVACMGNEGIAQLINLHQVSLVSCPDKVTLLDGLHCVREQRPYTVTGNAVKHPVLVHNCNSVASQHLGHILCSISGCGVDNDQSCNTSCTGEKVQCWN